eukprot:COSAG02_NODE_791_length_17158_cov_12.377396_9_plen_59_part_00
MICYLRCAYAPLWWVVKVWIKICASWVCYLLYTFIMILPPLCPNREFGDPPTVEEGAP